MVSAEVDKFVAQAKATIIPALEARYPGLDVRPGELRREQSEAVFQLVRNALFALLVIYGLLAVVLKSYSQPLMVLSAVPFGFVGAIWAHYFLAMPMTLGSLVVMVALAGGEGVAADYTKPLTVPLAFGVAFSTLVTLFLVPLCYAALEDVRGMGRLGWWRRGKAVAPLAALPVLPQGREKGVDDPSVKSREVRRLPPAAGRSEFSGKPGGGQGSQ